MKIQIQHLYKVGLSKIYITTYILLYIVTHTYYFNAAS